MTHKTHPSLLGCGYHPVSGLPLIPRHLAKQLNPIIGSYPHDTLANASALAAWLVEALSSTHGEGLEGADYAYLLGRAVKAALDFEMEAPLRQEEPSHD
ncbi:hypothetical protein [Methylococcus geothermalis]|uniref:Uncharacterized protein n=1 Tax=Methylococcus geothermalis TaxID=2681310 RepID=A0A858Q8I9_9GAMM|nr:hypothetical protein [Methylococcus geothermalis]QJD30188.1 hypothetical protein GNH96_09535 [Methylococcus geothermalis]